MYSNTTPNPITHSGQTIVNATRDAAQVRLRQAFMLKPENQRSRYLVYSWIPKLNSLGSIPGSSHIFDINPNEICLFDNSSLDLSRRKSNAGLQSTDVAVMSCANCLVFQEKRATSSQNKEDQNDRIDTKLEELNFAGVARSRANYDYHDKNHEKDFTIQTTGLTQLQNTLGEKLNPGDFIFWDLPRAGDVNHFKDGRVPFVFRKYNPTNGHTEQQAVRIFAKVFMYSNKPGQYFDVLLMN